MFPVIGVRAASFAIVSTSTTTIALHRPHVREASETDFFEGRGVENGGRIRDRELLRLDRQRRRPAS